MGAGSGAPLSPASPIAASSHPGAGEEPDPWLACEPQLNSRLLRPLLRFYERRFGTAALRALVTSLGTSPEVLEDPDRWFSASLMLRLNRAMVEATGDADVIYKAGRALADPGVLGPERLLIRGFSSPRGVYESMGYITGRYSRITRWEIARVGPGKVRATFVRDATAPDDPLFCANRRGALEAVPEVFDLPPARVEHPECIHRGDERCTYECHWVDRGTWRRPVLLVAGLTALGTPLAAAFGATHVALGLAGPALLLGAGALVLARKGSAAPALTAASARELQDLLERNTRRVRELQALQRVVDATRTVLDEEELLGNVLDQLTSVIGYDRALVLRVDEARGVLGGARSLGFGALAPLVDALEVSLDPANADEGLFGNVVRRGRALLVTDIDAYAARLLPQNRALLLALESRGFVAVPLEGRGAALGLLVVDRHRADAAPLSLHDRDLLEAVAAAVGAAMSNARLYEAVQEELLINRKFRQYLPPDAAEELRRDPRAALRLGGREEELAVMFCDVAGFTSMSAACAPAEVVSGLNWWFGIADPVLSSAQGIVDKRIGDGILAVFRHEPGRAHPVTRAVQAAGAMQRALERERPRLAEAAAAFAGMRVRHAIHFGPVVLGNIGSETRMEYTVIGDTVNICARVEELTPAAEVWLTDDALHAMGPVPGAERVQEVVLRGRSAPTGLWRVPA